MKKILIFVSIVLFTNCSKHIEKYRSCPYYSPTYDSIPSLVNIEKYKHLLADFESTDHESLKFVYMVRDPSLDTFFLLMFGFIKQDTVHIIEIKKDFKKENLNLYFLYNHKKAKKVKKCLEQIPNKYLVRDCMVMDGVDSGFYLYKKNNLFSYFGSSGYECWVADDSNIPNIYNNLFNLIKKMNKKPLSIKHM